MEVNDIYVCYSKLYETFSTMVTFEQGDPEEMVKKWLLENPTALKDKRFQAVLWLSRNHLWYANPYGGSDWYDLVFPTTWPSLPIITEIITQEHTNTRKFILNKRKPVEELSDSDSDSDEE